MASRMARCWPCARMSEDMKSGTSSWPRRKALGEASDKESLGGSAIHTRNGVVDDEVASEDEPESDGETHELEVPSGESSGLKLNHPFTLAPGTIHEATLDFDAFDLAQLHQACGSLQQHTLAFIVGCNGSRTQVIVDRTLVVARRLVLVGDIDEPVTG